MMKKMMMSGSSVLYNISGGMALFFMLFFVLLFIKLLSLPRTRSSININGSTHSSTVVLKKPPSTITTTTTTE